MNVPSVWPCLFCENQDASVVKIGSCPALWLCKKCESELRRTPTEKESLLIDKMGDCKDFDEFKEVHKQWQDAFKEGLEAFRESAV